MDDDRLAQIRARAQRHEEELASQRWFTPAMLAARWQVSASTVREIPAEELPYKTFGKPGSTKPRRRYRPEDVRDFEVRRTAR